MSSICIKTMAGGCRVDLVKAVRENPLADIYKTCNTGTNEEKYKLIKGGILTVPRYVDVELTNFCNFRCCFCPTGTRSVNRTKGYMPDCVVEALVENVRKYSIPAVRFIRWGEPTMHPKYIEIMKAVKDAGAKIHINTNGSLLDENKIRRLLDIPIDSIKFSFQGADEGTYNEMREGGDYNRLLKIVNMVNDLRQKIQSPPYVQISTTLTGETADQIENFKRDVENMCDYYNIGYTQLTHLSVDQMKVDAKEKEKIKALQDRERLHHEYLEVCNEAFDKLSVNWNGDVILCCSDYDNFMIVGNLQDMDFKQIFNSHAADAYRKMILEKQYGRIKCCSVCYERIPLNK